VDVELGYAGPLVGSLIVAGMIRIPAEANDDLTRTEDLVDCDFLTEITLTADSPTVKVLTAFNNVARNHRLRVLLPTGTKAKTCTADSTFDVLERPIRPKKYHDWVQPVAPTYPLRSFVNLSGKNRGLTITTKGLLEFEILEEQGCTIALTLVRSVGWLSKMGMSTRKDSAGPVVMTPGGQCLGANLVEYAITPHNGDWMGSQTYSESENFLLPLEPVFIPKSEERDGVVSRGFIEISPPSILLSALKESEDGKSIVLRVWNISEEEQESTFNFGFKVSSVKSARMDEVEDDSLKISMTGKNSFKTKIPSRRVATFLIQPE
jgi:mannosylglycerate hydrolase